MTEGRNRACARRLRHGARPGRRVRGTGLAFALALVLASVLVPRAGIAPAAAWAAAADGAAGAGDPAAVRQTYGPIGPYDTLWSIARRVRPGAASTTQTMAALVRLNPDAFIDGDVNRIRGGTTLEVPTEAEALGAAPAQAIAQPARDPAAARPAAEAATADPAAPPRPVTDGVSQRLDEALAERDRLAEENTGLTSELDRARITAARAEEEIVALREAVAKLEQEVAALEERLAAAPVRERTAAPDGETAATPFALVGWGVIAILALGAVGGAIYRQRRAHASGGAAAVADIADADDALEDPAAPAESSPATVFEPARESDRPSEEAAEEAAEASAAEAAEVEEAEDVVPVTAEPGGYSPNTKLNLARAYVNMGDEETAREVLEEVLAEGDAAERAAARQLLDEL